MNTSRENCCARAGGQQWDTLSLGGSCSSSKGLQKCHSEKRRQGSVGIQGTKECSIGIQGTKEWAEGSASISRPCRSTIISFFFAAAYSVALSSCVFFSRLPDTAHFWGKYFFFSLSKNSLYRKQPPSHTLARILIPFWHALVTIFNPFWNEKMWRKCSAVSFLFWIQ